MKIKKSSIRLLALLYLSALTTACDQLGDLSSGGGGAGEGVQQTSEALQSSGTEAADQTPVDNAAADQEGETQEQETEEQVTNSVVQLNAFKDFNCTSNWTNRDGGLGLRVGTGRGTCKTTFRGGSGPYDIKLGAQTEREGQSPYRISINGQVVSSGKFPYAQGKRICSCRQPWQRYCPDVVKQLDAGVHHINTGDVIEYYGEEEYLCGKHGAYSKWRGMTFTPAG